MIRYRQIADQFHLHQNLLEAIRNSVNAIVPVNIKIPAGHSKEVPLSMENKEEERKKTPCTVDNFAEYN